jgi:MFS family permease
MAAAQETSSRPWLTRDVLSISLSAGFADLGYQGVMAAFPLFLVLVLHAPVWAFGLAMALSYGGGPLFAAWGGRTGDRIGHRRTAILGNSLIPLLSLTGLFALPVAAVSFLCAGWWARNFRSPSRRAMLVEATADQHRSAAFGFLHGVDVAGGIFAAVYVTLLITAKVAWSWVFLVSLLPLAASTLMLTRARTGRAPDPEVSQQPSPPLAPARQSALRNLLWATAVYGFSSYSTGFPVLTAAIKTGSLVGGLLAFFVLQVVSSLTGLFLGGSFGQTLISRFQHLSVYGYGSAAVGSVLLAVGYGSNQPTWLVFLGVAIIGFALAVIETLEPTLVSTLNRAGMAGRGFGALTAYRAVGLLAANVVLGVLYSVGADYSYGYAALLAALAAVLILTGLPALRREASLLT